jgi:GNAT superfamily N-acetyltransferase
VDVAERVALGLVDAERKRRSKMPGAEVLEVDGLVLAFSNVADPALNAIVVEREPSDPIAALQTAEELARQRGHPLGLNLQVDRHPSIDAAVRDLGLARIIERPAFATTLSDLSTISPPADVEIRRVTDDEGAEALVEVGVQAFGDDPDVAGRFYASGAFGVTDSMTFTAWERGQPVAIAAAHLLNRAVGVFGVGVVPAARRRGIGSAITVHAARAFSEADLAWLHPSDMARRMYEGIGFRRVSDWEVWVRSGES